MGLAYLLTEVGSKLAPSNHFVFQVACTIAAAIGAFITVLIPGKIAPDHKSSIALVGYGLGATYLLAIAAPMGKFLLIPCFAALIVGYLAYRSFRRADAVDPVKVQHHD